MKKVIVGFTKEYQDAHWCKCRFGLDPRSCGRWIMQNGKMFWVDGCFATSKRDSDGELHNYCMRDDQRCDARWIE